MITINLHEFQDFDNKSIYEYLLHQQDTVFKISVFRDAIAKKDDDYDVFNEYLMAAYFGHCIADIADSFAYYVPEPATRNPFWFKATITDMEKLADYIYQLIQGMSDDDNETFINFHTSCADFLDQSFYEEIDCNTFGLLYIANRYLVKSMNNPTP